MNTNTSDAGSATAAGQSETRQLRRSGADKMLGGVSGGVARYLNTDPNLVRVGAAALALTTGIGVPLYLAAWLLVPGEDDDQPIAAEWLATGRRRLRTR